MTSSTGTETQTLAKFAEWLVRYGSAATILMPHFERVMKMACEHDFGHIALNVTLQNGRVVDVTNGIEEKWHYGLNEQERSARSEEVTRAYRPDLTRRAR